MNWQKFSYVVSFILLTAILYAFTPIGEFFTPESYARLKAWILLQGVWAPFWFVLLYIVGTFFFVPGSLLTVTAGALFGTGVGFICVLIGSNIGATLMFFLARHFGKDMANKLRDVGKLRQFQGKIKRTAFLLVFGLRLVPLVPFNALNYGLGLSPVPWKDYAIGTFFGLLPATTAYVTLGNVANAVTFESLRNPTSFGRPEIWGPVLMVLILFFATRYFRRKNASLSAQSDPQSE